MRKRTITVKTERVGLKWRLTADLDAHALNEFSVVLVKLRNQDYVVLNAADPIPTVKVKKQRKGKRDNGQTNAQRDSQSNTGKGDSSAPRAD